MAKSAPKITTYPLEENFDTVAKNGRLVFTKQSDEKKRETKSISKQPQDFTITLKLHQDEYHLVEDFVRPTTYNENTFQSKNKMGDFIRYSEGRAKITIKRPRREDAQSSQNPITLGFGSQSPSKQSNGLGFKDNMEESDTEQVPIETLEIDKLAQDQ